MPFSATEISPQTRRAAPVPSMPRDLARLLLARTTPRPNSFSCCTAIPECLQNDARLPPYRTLRHGQPFFAASQIGRRNCGTASPWHVLQTYPHTFSRFQSNKTRPHRIEVDVSPRASNINTRAALAQKSACKRSPKSRPTDVAGNYAASYRFLLAPHSRHQVTQACHII